MKSHFETLAEITKPSFTFDIWYRRMIGGEPEKDFEIDRGDEKSKGIQISNQ